MTATTSTTVVSSHNTSALSPQATGRADNAHPTAPAKGLKHWLMHFRRELWVVGIFSMVANLMMLAPTLYMLQVYDRVLSSRSELTLIVLSVVTLFFFSAMAFAEWSRSRVLVRVGVRMNELLSQRVFRASFDAHLHRPSMQPGKPLTDLTELRQFLTGAGVIAFFDAPWTPIYIAVLFFLHPMLGWTAIGFALVQSAVAYWGHRKALEPSQALALKQSQSLAQVQAKLRTSEAVEAMGMLEALRLRWHKYQQVYLEQHAQTHGNQHRITAISKWLRYAQQSLALGVGALLVIRGELSPGAMIAANVLTTRALAPIDMLVGSWRGFLSARQAYQRLSGLLAEFDGEPSSLQKLPPQGSLRLDQIVATAPGSTQPILKGVSLSLPPGSVTVVLGPSGSGKSTLARVMLGVWSTASGTVWWGERPIQAWSAEERGPAVGYLPQDVELFDGTLADNIARLNRVNPDQVIAAAKMAGLHDAILRFPKGYDTPIGVSGGLLSGGQRQRLGLARAIYGNPSLVVLDEPNANLDDVGEAALLQAVLQLKAQGASVLLISHRTNVIKVADQLVLMRDGQIQISGPRDDVLRALTPAPAATPPHPT
jgi:ATP-binding cassette subfamily C exporter for protease/lipase